MSRQAEPELWVVGADGRGELLADALRRRQCHASYAPLVTRCRWGLPPTAERRHRPRLGEAAWRGLLLDGRA